MMRFHRVSAGGVVCLLALLLLPTTPAVAQVSLVQVAIHHEAVAEHADQAVFNSMVAGGNMFDAFILAFEEGDELFEGAFNALDGGGANVGDGLRFSRVPRADKNAPGEWATHTPKRETGPNAQACIDCHNTPFPDGAGVASSNVARDPLHSGKTQKMIVRNTPHMFGSGALQVLAEEMTAELHAIVQAAEDEACDTGTPVTMDLIAKGVHYGTVTGIPGVGPGNGNGNGNGPPGAGECGHIINAEGISDDLIVRPYQWKGVEPTMRSFNVGALHNEIGMQPVETTGLGVDGDGDGVVNEFGVGDVTALTVYLAAQPRPVTLAELASVGLADELTTQQEADIAAGSDLFEQIGCADCHIPALVTDSPWFSEPSQYATHQPNPLPAGLDPTVAIQYNMTTDLPDNLFELPGGDIHLGNFEADAGGGAIVRLYGDLKRHDMGAQLAESIDEHGTGNANFITKELWGVADTAPYLHDGRATTLTEAILWHGGEAAASRDEWNGLTDGQQGQILEFLGTLKLLLNEEEE